MPLLERVGEIFAGIGEEGTQFSNSLRRFLVYDGGMDQDSTVVLLAESPSEKEVEPDQIDCRHPLAGDSGTFISNKLAQWKPELDFSAPIGKLVHETCEVVCRLGVMNVSQLPFERKAYARSNIASRPRDCRDHESWGDFLKCMEYIREHPVGKTYKNMEGHRNRIDNLERAIVEDLAQRLPPIGEDVKVMCLGERAQIFYLKSHYYRSTHSHILDFPHPSHGHWSRLEPQHGPRLQDVLDCLWPTE